MRAAGCCGLLRAGDQKEPPQPLGAIPAAAGHRGLVEIPVDSRCCPGGHRSPFVGSLKPGTVVDLIASYLPESSRCIISQPWIEPKQRPQFVRSSFDDGRRPPTPPTIWPAGLLRNQRGQRHQTSKLTRSHRVGQRPKRIAHGAGSVADVVLAQRMYASGESAGTIATTFGGNFPR